MVAYCICSNLQRISHPQMTLVGGTLLAEYSSGSRWALKPLRGNSEDALATGASSKLRGHYSCHRWLLDLRSSTASA